jgi:hypothetical protein
MSFSNFIPVQPKKCQCISLNSSGFITESDNSLFNTGSMMGKPVMLQIPYLKKIFYRVRKLKPGDKPLFFQNIKVNVKNFPAVCDFVFTKVEYTDGEYILWFVYDNSFHFAERKDPVSE